MALASGIRLGPYEVLAAIGAGGMGEVYRARDTKLGRDVALKILPDTFTQDPERVARFRREAQVLAALNHPHIAQIHGLEEANGTQFLVLELVDGESLDKRIARGPLPIDVMERVSLSVRIVQVAGTFTRKSSPQVRARNSCSSPMSREAVQETPICNSGRRTAGGWFSQSEI